MNAPNGLQGKRCRYRYYGSYFPLKTDLKMFDGNQNSCGYFVRKLCFTKLHNLRKKGGPDDIHEKERIGNGDRIEVSSRIGTSGSYAERL